MMLAVPARRQTPPATTVRSAGASVRGGTAAHVLLVAGPSTLVTRNLEREIVLGRDVACDIPLESPKISRRHARVVAGVPVTVQDLGSTNGIRVAGKKHVGGGPVAIEPGDSFQIGPFSVLLLPGAADNKPTDPPRARLIVDDPTPEGVPAPVARIAASEINLVIHGETGAGKEVLARTVHALSKRRGPFLALNCAAVHEGLLESELFGHERGAFTGAVQAKPGLLESAAGGTVFLDEIGDLPASVQAKLLRVLEAREVFRLGSVKPVRLDVRFIAATHRNLRDEVAHDRFREDLYFRLNGVSLVIPPLRERRGAILTIAQQLLRGEASISADAAAALHQHSWPGNVRELRTVLERALVISDRAEIRVEHLFLEPPIERAASSSGRDLTPEEAAERTRIVAALDAAAGNQTRAAKALGMSRATFVTKLAIYRIARPHGR
jgi:DNA-binding NtrC family response regulator